MPLTVFPAGIVKGIVAIKLKLPATPLTGSMSSVNFSLFFCGMAKACRIEFYIPFVTARMKPSRQVGSVADHIGWWRVLAAVRAAGIAELWSVFDRHRVFLFPATFQDGREL